MMRQNSPANTNANTKQSTRNKILNFMMVGGIIACLSGITYLIMNLVIFG